MKNERIMVNPGNISNIVTILCIIYAFLGICPSPALSQYGGGSGTEDTPYQISTAAHFTAISDNPDDWDSYFILNNNISLLGVSNEYVPIGIKTDMFDGHFNGNGKKITDFVVSRDVNSNPVGDFGLFGYIGSNGVVENVTVENGYIKMFNKGWIGFIAGRNSGTIRNCHVSGYIEAGWILGGIAGKSLLNATITNCSVTEIEITGSSNAIGGLVGESYSNISKCYVMTESGKYLETDTSNVGGLVAFCGDYGSITNCYAIADVRADGEQAGGLVGYAAPQSTISYCYSAGNQTVSNSNRGGLVAYFSGTISSCLWDTSASDSANAFGYNYGTSTEIFGYDTADMKTEQNYIDAGWDLTSTWYMINGEYPILASLPDVTINYESSHDDVLDNTIIIPIEVSNLSSFGGGEYVTISIYTSLTADPDWDAIADTQTPTIIGSEVPDAGDSINQDIDLGIKSEVGEYYYRMKINGDFGLNEGDTTNNWGPELTVKIFDALIYEDDDDSISGASGQTPSFPRTASIYPSQDEDWVKLEVSAVSQVTVRLENSYEENLAIELYDDAGSPANVTPNSAEGDGLAEFSVMLAPAVYYLKIYQPDDNILMQYTLNVEKETLLTDVEVELNDTTAIYRELTDPTDPSFIDIYFTLQNGSQITTGNFDYQLVFSASDTIDISDPNTYATIGGVSGTISLDPAEEYNGYLSFLPDNQVLGDKYYAIIADFGDALSESNENNNLSSSLRIHTYELDEFEDDYDLINARLIPYANKQIRSIEPVADEDYMYFRVDQKSKITIEITSETQLKLSLMKTDDLYDPNAIVNIDFDSASSIDDKYIWTVLLERDTYYLKVNEPGNDIEVPQYTIEVDSTIHAPDLTCEMVNKYMVVTSGTTGYQATVLISNYGSDSATDVNAVLKKSYSKDADWSTAEIITALDNTISPAEYEKDVSGTFTFDIPATDGIYYLKAFVDSDSEHDEIDEDNNYSPTVILAVDDEYGYSGGNGTESSPWQISTAFDLNMISEILPHYESYFELANDIDLSNLEDEYVSIGSSVTPFMGVVDGQNYTISNYVINSSGKATGIFGVTDKSSTVISEISNIKLTGVDITSENYSGACGALVGNNSCNVLKCSVSGTIDSDGSAGMLVGSNEANGIILYCYAYQSTINCNGSDSGMLVGNNSGIIMKCYADEGIISGVGNIGGLIGTNSGSIYDCYSLATIMATSDNVGGLAGVNSGVIAYCYSTGSVSVPTNLVYGGFCGLNSGSLSSCFWSIDESGISYDMSSGIGVEGLTETEMLDKSIYEAAGWLFGDTLYSSWLMADGHILPKLKSLYGFSGGEGTIESPYLLDDYVDLLLAGDLLGMHYKLSSDIDLSDRTFDQPLFGDYNNNRPFTGTFDGDGHAIESFSLLDGRSFAGFFGYIKDIDSDDDYIAGVSNLAIYNPTVETDLSSDYAGIIASVITNGKLENCAVRDANLIASNFVGGLVGTANNSIISNCCFEGVIGAIEFVGGLAGGWRNSTVTNCYSDADILAIDKYYGLSGYSSTTTTEKCYYGPNIYATYWGENLQSNADFWYSSDTGWDMIYETTNGSDDLWKVVDGYGYPWLYYETIEGDLDNNDRVDIADFGLLADDWLDSMYFEDLETICETWLLEVYTN